MELNALGVSRPFDSYFNTAHFVKISAYALILLGLTLDYIHAYRLRFFRIFLGRSFVGVKRGLRVVNKILEFSKSSEMKNL